MRNLDQRQNGTSFVGKLQEIIDIQRKSCYLLWKLIDFENHGQRWSQQQEEEQQQQQPLTCAFENDATCTSEDCCDRHWNCPQCTGCFSRCEVVHDVELCTIQISISISFNTRDIKTSVLFFSGYYFQQISTQQTLATLRALVSLERLRFSMFDLDGDGHINMEELRHLLSGDGGSAMVSDLLPDGQTVDEAEAYGESWWKLWENWLFGDFRVTSCRHEQKVFSNESGNDSFGRKGSVSWRGTFFLEKEFEFDGDAMNLHHLGIDVFVVLGVPRS